MKRALLCNARTVTVLCFNCITTIRKAMWNKMSCLASWVSTSCARIRALYESFANVTVNSRWHNEPSHRVRSRLPIRSAGLCWRGTSFSTRRGQLTEIWLEWLFWRAALSSCASPMSSLHSRWCGTSQDWEHTSLLLKIRPVRRAGSRLCCLPITATWLYLWQTWRENTEVRDTTPCLFTGGRVLCPAEQLWWALCYISCPVLHGTCVVCHYVVYARVRLSSVTAVTSTYIRLSVHNSTIS